MKRLNFKNIFSLVGCIIIAWALYSCDKIENPFLKEKKSEGYENQPPETYLFLFFKSDTFTVQDTTYDSGEPVIVKDTIITTLDTTSSRQEIHWWGEDPDGEVIGYYYQWNYEDTPTFTTAEAGTFYVPIQKQYDLFDFAVQAVDDDSLVDLTPARLTFPVFNTRPYIEFRLKSNPSAPLNNPNVTSYTFPTRTFVWDATDADGNETITNILWALDDTTEWNIIECKGTVIDRITLRDIDPGSHVFFVKVVDVASAQSNTIMFPDTTDDEVPNHWVVKEPVGDVLLVDDYYKGQTTSEKEVQTFYSNIIAQITDNNYSLWEIGDQVGNIYFNVENSLPYSSTDIEAYLGYFKSVVWFTKVSDNHLDKAGLSMTKYLNNEGNLFVCNGGKRMPDTTWQFTAIDSIFTINPGGDLIPVGVNIVPHYEDHQLNTTLGLQVGTWIFWDIAGIYTNNKFAKEIYTFEHSDSTEVEVPYIGKPCVAIHYEPDFTDGESIYFSIPLDLCNGKGNVKDLLDYFINNEFED